MGQVPSIDLTALKEDYERGALTTHQMMAKHGFRNMKTMYNYLRKAGVAPNRNPGGAARSSHSQVDRWLETAVIAYLRNPKIVEIVMEALGPMAKQLGFEETMTKEAVEGIIHRFVPKIGKPKKELDTKTV